MNGIDKTQKMIAVWASDKERFDKMLDGRSRAAAFHKMLDLLESMTAVERAAKIEKENAK